ncbi:hypothetical protein ABZ079_36200 [Streptomyces sp. NPDC006314]|uniref:hypothetical protein n=1 Tax=Streptomyces sp. NPDC006314 TaxID=3154475 RepID=UPI0033B572D8
MSVEFNGRWCTNPEKRTVTRLGNASPVQPRQSKGASRAQIGTLRGVWCFGVLAIIVFVLLIIGGFAADSKAGETGQPAGVLGLIVLFLGLTVLIVGMLARFVVAKPERR